MQQFLKLKCSLVLKGIFKTFCNLDAKATQLTSSFFQTSNAVLKILMLQFLHTFFFLFHLPDLVLASCKNTTSEEKENNFPCLKTELTEESVDSNVPEAFWKI